jgi:hypothetical protein
LNYDEVSPLWTAPNASLLRISYERLEARELFTGEIEWIKNVSPAGTYVALQMDNDGLVASNNILGDNQTSYLPTGTAITEIVDLRNGESVFRTEGGLWDDIRHDPMPLTWISDDTFLLSGASEYGYNDILVQLGEFPNILAEFETSAIISPSKQNILLVNGDIPITVYDIVSGIFTPIIEDRTDYHVSANWNADDTLSITIVQDDFTLAQWLITDWG